MLECLAHIRINPPGYDAIHPPHEAPRAHKSHTGLTLITILIFGDVLRPEAGPNMCEAEFGVSGNFGAEVWKRKHTKTLRGRGLEAETYKNQK